MTNYLTHRILNCCVLLVSVIWFAGCEPIAGSWVFHEVNRIQSPDGQAEAVILEGSAGATTTTETRVLIVPTGEKVKTKGASISKNTIFQANDLLNFKVIWKHANLLEIQYAEATIYHFQNLYVIWKPRPMSYAVEACLAPTSTNFSVRADDRMSYPTKGW